MARLRPLWQTPLQEVANEIQLITEAASLLDPGHFCSQKMSTVRRSLSITVVMVMVR